MTDKDKIFDRPLEQASDFVFNNQVVEVFDDMVSRSVPFYHELQRMMVELAEQFAQPGTNIYDLGSSTGTTLCALCKRLQNKQISFIGIDNSQEMLAKAEEKLKAENCLSLCTLEFGDLNKEVHISNASVVILSWTLQFIRPLNRDRVLSVIHSGLVDGGCVIINEKILGPSSLLNRLYIDFYYNFKKRQGYSELEIAQKREALENVLIPYRIDENLALLERSGFSTVDVFFRWYNWGGFIAIK